MDASSRPDHVVIAGGGVAAVECALALHDLAGDRVRLTIIAPEPEFALRPLRTAEPFSRGQVRRHRLDDLAARVGAELITGSLVRVDAEQHTLLCTGEERPLAYDALVLAVGAEHRTAFRKALTFTGDRSTLNFNGLLADIDQGYSHTVSFVVPPGTTWPLPLYELALMTAQEAWTMGIEDINMQLVSPEPEPLALFGAEASAAVAALLEKAGIAFRGNCSTQQGDDGSPEVLPEGTPLDSQRVVALPTIEGLTIVGVPTGERGFIPVDEHGRVTTLPDVYAAGDATTYPIKQGGLACQQADAVAEVLAAAAGADVHPTPFHPVLRGRLLTGHGAAYLEHALHGGAGDTPPREMHLWSVAHKIDGRYLSPWLAELETDQGSTSMADDHAGDLTIDVALPVTATETVPAG
ncbi:FAD-dependent oxidoreductase [Conexibacter woesei]|uniref:FAD-dependent oxidoreductase n=1 Tax=Conexibacter woesei TaxID=191495 RepID=UPI0004205A23|nr:FAD-dependent oxidoreductase [Conexibacter woesei]